MSGIGERRLEADGGGWGEKAKRREKCIDGKNGRDGGTTTE